MNKTDEFYIGWQDKEPTSFRRAFRWFFGTVLLAMITVALLFVKAEEGFIDSYFDYGNLTELEGRLVLEPIPALLTTENEQRKTIPLVGFGKFGANPVLKAFAEQVEGDITDYQVLLRGTIFQYQDKKWMELTEGEESVRSYEKAEPLKRQIATIGQMQFSGEIVDPKCFFGVMNPGAKGAHRSCAIRCISGGVPPVLAIRRDGVFVDYYAVTNEDQSSASDKLLPYVGIPVKLGGTVVVYDDWKILTMTAGSLQITSSSPGLSPISLCLD